MSLRIDVLQEIYSADREQLKGLTEAVDQLGKSNDRLGNELSLARPDHAEITGDERSASENDEDATESGGDLNEYLEPQPTDAKDLYWTLQTALNAPLNAPDATNKELSDRNDELQMALDNADQSEASGDGEYVQELQYSLRQKQQELDTVQEKNKLLNDQLEYVAEANWENMRPFLDKNLTKRVLSLRKNLSASDTELSKVKEELSKVKEELSKPNTELLKSEANSTELGEENQALRRDLETKSAEIDALRKEIIKSAAKAKKDPIDSELQRLKDRRSLYHSNW